MNFWFMTRVLNADCGGRGEIWVELQDTEGRPPPGHSLDEAVSIERNGTAQEPELAKESSVCGRSR